jgi:hypothetical protein
MAKSQDNKYMYMNIKVSRSIKAKVDMLMKMKQKHANPFMEELFLAELEREKENLQDYMKTYYGLDFSHVAEEDSIQKQSPEAVEKTCQEE